MGFLSNITKGIGKQVANVTGASAGYEHNKEMAKYGYSKDLEMWNKQNQYNTPTAQMGRLEEAGLNPNMMYGQGSTSNTGNAKEMPKYNAPTADFKSNPTALISMLGMFSDIQQKNANRKRIKESAENTRLDNLYKLASMSDRLQNVKSKAARELIQEEIDRATKELKIEKYSLDTETARINTEFKREDKRLYEEKGYTTKDSPWIRIIGKLMEDKGNGIFKSFLDKLLEKRAKNSDGTPNFWINPKNNKN